jgi:hypothetical protein
MFNCVILWLIVLFCVLMVLFYALFVSIVLFYVLFECKYVVLYYCHRMSTQLQLTDISYHIYQDRKVCLPTIQLWQ